MGVTFNGKSWEQIRSELAAAFPPEMVKDLDVGKGRSVPYIKHECYKERLDDVLGTGGYDWIPIDGQPIVSFATVNGKEHVIYQAMLVIRSDDGLCEKKVAGCAVETLKPSKDSKEVDMDNLAIAARNTCIRNMLAFWGVGVAQLKQAKGNARDDALYPDAVGGYPEGNVDVVITLKEDFRQGKGVLMADGTDAEGRSVAVRVFENQFPEIEKQCSIRSFVSQMKAGKTFRFNGFYQPNRGKLQLVFNSASREAS